MSGEDDDRPSASPPQSEASLGIRRPDLGVSSASLSLPIADSGVIAVVDLGAAPTLVSQS